LCGEVLTADGTCVVLDCGTGARELGLALLAADPPPIPLVLSHTHWDHIFHVHSAPDVFGRSLDDDDTAELAARKQMGGWC
jgi:glyoxylase-like metal-dependent hydrolase (beta-lactamase superfamily II)